MFLYLKVLILLGLKAYSIRRLNTFLWYMLKYLSFNLFMFQLLCLFLLGNLFMFHYAFNFSLFGVGSPAGLVLFLTCLNLAIAH